MGFTSDLFGSKPKVPAFVPVDASAEQIKAAEGNLGVMPSATKLASEVNTFNQAELDRLYATALPGYESTRAQIGKNIGSLVRGEIPSDIADIIGRSAAGRALYGGYGGSEMARNLTARDLGTTSLSLMERGQSAAERWLAGATAPRFDITSMFLSAPQRVAHAVGERDTKFQRDWLDAQIEAAPDPGVAGWWNTGWGVVNAVISAYTGTATDFGTVDPKGSFSGFQSGSVNTGGQAFDAGGDFGNQFSGYA